MTQLKCVNPPQFSNPIISSRWTYRLGDTIRGQLKKRYDKDPLHNPCPSYICKHWPGSLGCSYQQRNSSYNNVKLLHEIMNLTCKGDTNANITMFVHLRLGDVLDLPYYINAGCVHIGCIWVKPLDHYKYVRIPKFVQNIQLIGNPEYRRGAFSLNNSYTYVSNITAIFETRGFNVTFLSHHNADDDLRRMACATYFMKSGGGFSLLASKLVMLRGGKLI